MKLCERKKLQQFVNNEYFVEILNELDNLLDKIKQSTIDQIIRMFTYCPNESKEFLLNNICEYSKNSIQLGTRSSKESYLFRYGPIEGELRFQKYSNTISQIHKEQYKNGREIKFLRNVDDYVKYGYTEEYAVERISNRKTNAAVKSAEAQKDKTDQKPNQIGYWLKKGYTEEQSKILVSERQTTFSLQKCIEKYGEVDGRNRWQKRQDVWQATLNSKSPEEKKEINKKKASYVRPNYDSLKESTILTTLEDYFDIHIERQCVLFLSNIDSHRSFDGRYGKILIEFNGDYWHCNPSQYNETYYHEVMKKTAKEIWQYDNNKILGAESIGYKVFTIWESELEYVDSIIERFKNVIGR